MNTNIGKCGFTLIEFCLSILALFLLLIITYPILLELTERTQISQIKENLSQIQDYADEYFEGHEVNSVSLYMFIGPRKVISDFQIIADEKYPETIFRDKKISAFSKKYGTISVR